MLSGDLSTTSQSSTRAQAERITATRYYKLHGGHWLPPFSGASGSSICWVSCRPHQLCCWSCLQLCLIVHTVRWTRGRQSASGKLEENARSQRNCRCVYSLLAGAAAVAADITWHNITTHNLQGFFQVKLMYTYRTKVACGQVGTSWRAYAVSATSALSCYITVQSQCLQNMGPEGVRAWGERAWREPLVEFPTAAMGIDFKSAHHTHTHTHTHTTHTPHTHTYTHTHTHTHTPYMKWWMW